jgi:hypothetical protein
MDGSMDYTFTITARIRSEYSLLLYSLATVHGCTSPTLKSRAFSLPLSCQLADEYSLHPVALLCNAPRDAVRLFHSTTMKACHRVIVIRVRGFHAV